MNSFASQVRAARTAARLTLSEAAALVGVSRRQFAYWESGDAEPPAESKLISRERVLTKLQTVKPKTEK